MSDLLTIGRREAQETVDFLRTLLADPSVGGSYPIRVDECHYVLNADEAQSLVHQYNIGLPTLYTTFADVHCVTQRLLSSSQSTTLAEVEALCNRLGLSFTTLLPYFSEGAHYHIVDEMCRYLEQNANRILPAGPNLKGPPLTRPVTIADLAGGLLALIALAEFQSLLDGIRNRRWQEITTTIPAFRVIELRKEIVEGKIAVGVDPSLPKEMHNKGVYDARTNTIWLHSNILSLEYGSQGNKWVFPARVTALHELVHALHDRDRQQRRHSETEGPAWYIQNVYEYLLFGPDRFRELTKTVDNAFASQTATRARLCKGILPPEMLAFAEQILPTALIGVASRGVTTGVIDFLRGNAQAPTFLQSLQAVAKRYADAKTMWMFLKMTVQTRSVLQQIDRGQLPSVILPSLGTGAPGEGSTTNVSRWDTWFHATKEVALKWARKYQRQEIADGSHEWKQLTQYVGVLHVYLALMTREDVMKGSALSPIRRTHYEAIIRQLFTFLELIDDVWAYDQPPTGLEHLAR